MHAKGEFCNAIVQTGTSHCKQTLKRKLATQLKKSRMSLANMTKIVFIPQRVQLGTAIETRQSMSLAEFEVFWRPRLAHYVAYETKSWAFFHLKAPEHIDSVFTIGDHCLHMTDMPESSPYHSSNVNSRKRL